MNQLPFISVYPNSRTAAARHLALVERQIHVFRRIAVQVVDLKRAVAIGKITVRKRIGTAFRPAPAVAAGGLLA